VLELALGERDLDLDAPLGEMQVERNQGVAALLDLADQAPDFLGVHEQLAGARRIRRDVRRSAAERTDVRAEQPERAFVHDDVGIADLRAAGAYRFYLPAFEHESGLVAVLYEVVVKCLAVFGDGHGGNRALAPISTTMTG